MIDETIVAEETPFYTYPCRVDGVVDGDTIDATVDLGFETRIIERIRARNVDTREISFVSTDSEEYETGMRQKEAIEQWVTESEQRSNMDWPFVLLSQEFKRGMYGRVIGDVYSRHKEQWWTEYLLDEFGKEVRYRE
jgi:micrococcal nuclease